MINEQIELLKKLKEKYGEKDSIKITTAFE